VQVIRFERSISRRSVEKQDGSEVGTATGRLSKLCRSGDGGEPPFAPTSHPSFFVYSQRAMSRVAFAQKAPAVRAGYANGCTTSLVQQSGRSSNGHFILILF